MRQIWTIAKKELASFFDSLTAYIIIIVFLSLTGFFSWIFGTDIFLNGQANLKVFFTWSYWTLFFFIPAITMKLVAEENRTGTLELLMTKPIDHLQFISGKFLATLILIAITLALTISYYITVANIGNIDHGATICGYIGLLMISAVYISIGIFASSITNNQIVSFILALFIGIFFHWIFGLMGSLLTGFFGEFLDYLSTQSHFESISRGVIDTKDIIYFVSLTGIGLYASIYALEMKKS